MKKLLFGVLLGLAGCAATAPQSPPQILSFRPSSYYIRTGETVFFEWELAGGAPDAQRFIYPDGNSTEVSGSYWSDKPKRSGSYILEVSNAAGVARDRVPITIK